MAPCKRRTLSSIIKVLVYRYMVWKGFVLVNESMIVQDDFGKLMCCILIT